MKTYRKTFKIFVFAILFVAISLMLFGCAKKFDITFDFNGGKWNDKTQEVLTLKRGSTISKSQIPTPTKENFDFDGWFQGNSRIELENYEVKSKETFKANWKPIEVKKFEVKLDENIAQYFNFENNYLAGQKVEKGTKVIFTLKNIPPTKRVKVVKANDENLSKNAEDKYEITLNADIVLSITFEEQDVAVVVKDADKTYISFLNDYTSGRKIFKGEKVSFNVINIPTGKKVEKVKANDEVLTAISDTYEVVVNENITISLEFINTFKLIINNDENRKYVTFIEYTEGTYLTENSVVNFKVTVPSELILDKVLKDTIVITPHDGIYSVVLDKDYVISLEIKANNTELEDVDAEVEKVTNAFDNNKLRVNQDDIPSVKTKIESLVDNGVVNIEVTKLEPLKYNVVFIHKDNNEVTITKVIEIVVTNYYSLTLPTQITSNATNNANIEENFEVVLTITIPDDKQLKVLLVNSEDKTSQVLDNKYKFNITTNITVTVEFELTEEYKATIKAELDEVTNVLVIAPDGVISIDEVKNKVDAIINTSVVLSEVREETGKYILKVQSIKYNELFFEKEITVTIETVTITIHFGDKALYNGNNTHAITINKNANLFENQLPDSGFITVIDPNFVFVGYSREVNGALINFGVNGINIPDNLDIYVVLLDNTVSVRFVADNILDTSQFNKTLTINKGQTVSSIGSPIRPGYKFSFWALSSNLTEEYTFSNAVNNSIELHAVFNSDSYLDYTILPSDEYTVSGINDNTINELYIPQTYNDKKVVSIKHRAFHKNSKISKLVITGEITEIGTWSFFDSSLKVIDLGSHIKTIGESAFYNTEVENITIPKTLEHLGAYAFAKCKKLVNVTFENEDFKAISRVQFEDSKYLDNLLANSTNNVAIANGILLAATKNTPKDIVIPNTVTHIGEKAFKVKDLTLEELTFESDSQLTHIGSYAFEGMKLPTTLVIPKSVKHIGFRAFYKVSGVEEVSYEDGSVLESVRPEAFAKSESLITYKLPVGFTAISKRQFSRSVNFLNIVNTDAVTYIGEQAFFGTKWYSVNSLDSYGSPKKFVTFNDKILLFDAKSTDADEIPATIEYIAPGAFYRSKRSSLTIPQTVKEIYSDAFLCNGSLKQLHISGYIQNIHKHAFDFHAEYEGYIGKLIVTIDDFDEKPDKWDDNWNIVREYDFNVDNRIQFVWSPVCTVSFDLNGGSSLSPINPITVNSGESIAVPNVEVTLDGKIFVGWEYDGGQFTSDTIITKSMTVTAKFVDVNPDYELRYENDSLTFVKFNNNELTSFVIPNSVDDINITTIDHDAFAGKTNLQEITLPAHLTTINTQAFADATSLETINYSESVVNFGKDAFKGTKYLKTIHDAKTVLIINKVLVDATTLENEYTFEGIQKIAGYAFNGNTTLTKVVFNEGLTHIESYAFTGATALVNIVLPVGANYVKANAFAIGGSQTVVIDCSAVSYAVPFTWEDGYINGDGATLNFIWEAVTTHAITLPSEVTITDATINPNFIKDGLVIELEIAIKEYHTLTEFTVNGNDKLGDIVDNKYNLTVTEDIVITVKYELETLYKDQLNAEFNKLKDVIGYYKERQNAYDSIVETMEALLNTDVVSFELTANGENYDIKLSLKFVPTYSQTKENVQFKSIGKINTSGTQILKASGSTAHEVAANAFDKRHATKWCDNGNKDEKFVLAKLPKKLFISRFAITHAGFKETHSMNTGEFKILVGTSENDLHEVVYVVNNTASRTYHVIAGEEIQFVKLLVLQGENMGAAHIARIYEIELFGLDEDPFDVTIDYNGGNYKGDTLTTLRMHKNTAIFDKDLKPLTRNKFEFKGYKELGQTTNFNFSFTFLKASTTLVAQWEMAPFISQRLDDELNKIKEHNFIITNETILTNELVKAYVETIVDTVGFEVEATNISGDVFSIKVSVKGDPDFYKSRNYKFYLKKENEKVNVTFVLNGGLYNDSTDNVVVLVDKGEGMPESDVVAVIKANYQFIGWKIGGEFIDPTTYLYKDDVTYVANWKIDNNIERDVNTEKHKINFVIGIVCEHSNFTNEVKLNHLQSLVDSSIVSLTLVNTSGYQYVVTITSVIEPTYSVEMTIFIYRLVEVQLPDCMQLNNPIKSGYLAVGYYGNSITTTVSEGYLITLAASTVGITNTHEYNQETIFSPNVEEEATIVKIEINKTLDTDKIYETLNKLVNDLKSIYTFNDLTAVDENVMLTEVTNSNEIYGMNTTIESLGDNIYQLKFTSPLDENIFRTRKVLAVKGSELYEDQVKITNNHRPRKEYSSQLPNHTYADFFKRNGNAVDLSTYWQAQKYESNTKESYLAFQMPESLKRKKFTIRIYHGGTIGLDNNQDFKVFYGYGYVKDAWNPSKRRLIKTYKDNTNNFTDVEVDLTKGLNQKFFIVVAIKKGSDNHCGLLVGVDILAQSSIKEARFNLNGGNIGGDTGNIRVATVNGKIPEALIPNNPTKEGRTFGGWMINGTLVQPDALKDYKFTDNLTEITAVWN